MEKGEGGARHAGQGPRRSGGGGGGGGSGGVLVGGEGGRQGQVWPARGLATEVEVNVNANAHTAGTEVILLSKENYPVEGKQFVHERRCWVRNDAVYVRDTV